MKNKSVLKLIRTIIAVAVIVPFIFLFVDFSGSELKSLQILAKIQIIPAILAGSFIVFATLFALTLLFGRVYCSVICPFGILQDVLARLQNIGKKKNKRKKYKYAKQHNILRYSVLALSFILVVLGYSAALAWLDPYSNFGRISKNVFGTIYIWLNNLGADVLNIHALYHVNIKPFISPIFYISLISLLAIAVAVILRGRIFCNTLCPAGALLSLVSRFSIFKLKLNSNCNGCGVCAMKCKAQCIDTKNRDLDFSRCVTCYNCMNSCNRNAVGYTPFWKKDIATIENESEVKSEASAHIMTKRKFIATGLATVAAIAVKAEPNNDVTYVKKFTVTPPGSKAIKHLLHKCTACHLCIARCPTGVLKPAFMQYGAAGIMMPFMDYKASFCNFECKLCTEVCPNGALETLTIEGKKKDQIGKAIFVTELCVVYNDETDCGACSEHCPTKAVDMVPYKNTRIPKVDQSICIGCGGCEFICPVRPLKAIYVEGNETHLEAKLPNEEKKEDIKLDGFGF